MSETDYFNTYHKAPPRADKPSFSRHQRQKKICEPDNEEYISAKVNAILEDSKMFNYFPESKVHCREHPALRAVYTSVKTPSAAPVCKRCALLSEMINSSDCNKHLNEVEKSNRNIMNNFYHNFYKVTNRFNTFKSREVFVEEIQTCIQDIHSRIDLLKQQFLANVENCFEMVRNRFESYANDKYDEYDRYKQFVAKHNSETIERLIEIERSYVSMIFKSEKQKFMGKTAVYSDDLRRFFSVPITDVMEIKPNLRKVDFAPDAELMFSSMLRDLITKSITFMRVVDPSKRQQGTDTINKLENSERFKSNPAEGGTGNGTNTERTVNPQNRVLFVHDKINFFSVLKSPSSSLIDEKLLQNQLSFDATVQAADIHPGNYLVPEKNRMQSSVWKQKTSSGSMAFAVDPIPNMDSAPSLNESTIKNLIPISSPSASPTGLMRKGFVRDRPMTAEQKSMGYDSQNSNSVRLKQSLSAKLSMDANAEEGGFAMVSVFLENETGGPAPKTTESNATGAKSVFLKNKDKQGELGGLVLGAALELPCIQSTTEKEVSVGDSKGDQRMTPACNGNMSRVTINFQEDVSADLEGMSSPQKESEEVLLSNENDQPLPAATFDSKVRGRTQGFTTRYHLIAPLAKNPQKRKTVKKTNVYLSTARPTRPTPPSSTVTKVRSGIAFARPPQPITDQCQKNQLSTCKAQIFKTLFHKPRRDRDSFVNENRQPARFEMASPKHELNKSKRSSDIAKPRKCSIVLREALPKDVILGMVRHSMTSKPTNSTEIWHEYTQRVSENREDRPALPKNSSVNRLFPKNKRSFEVKVDAREKSAPLGSEPVARDRPKRFLPFAPAKNWRDRLKAMENNVVREVEEKEDF